MKKKTRRTILLICIVLFLVIAPYIVFYSLGYRIDFEKMKITATGGIYVKTYPVATEVVFDSKNSQKPSFFSHDVFVQSMLPKSHSVLIKKDGYFDYSKNLIVEEGLATKLENVLLIKKDIPFSSLADKINYFSISPDNNVLLANISSKNVSFQYSALSLLPLPAAETLLASQIFSLPLQNASINDVKWSNDSTRALIKIKNLNGTYYYIFDKSKQKQQTVPLSYLSSNSQNVLFNPQDAQQIFFIKSNALYSAKGGVVTVLIKNATAYKISGNNILWTSAAGILSKSDMAGKLAEEINEKPVAQNKYEIFLAFDKTFLKSDNSLLVFNPEKKAFDDFKAPIDSYNLLLSPDGQKLVFYNGNKIYVYLSQKPKEGRALLHSSNDEIDRLFWLNNDYLVFSAGNKIMISEIDYRGNVNAVTIQPNLPPGPESKSPEIYFNQPDGKIYILSNSSLYSSEKITQ